MHVGIILDGNRRFAKRHGWKPWVGHDKGMNKLDNIIDWMLELDIFEMSLYCFSIQNFGRSELEKKHLFDIFRREAKKLLDDKRVYDNKIKIRFAGRISMFPSDMQDLMKELMTDPQLKKVAAKVAKFAQGIIEEINHMPEDMKKKQLQIGALDETTLLGKAEAFFRREFNAKIHTYREDDKKIHDPQSKAGYAKPYRPAIFVV